MIGSLTYLDAALIAIAFISGLLAMYRGLTRELLSILSWIIAALAVLYFVISHKPFILFIRTTIVSFFVPSFCCQVRR